MLRRVIFRSIEVLLHTSLMVSAAIGLCSMFPGYGIFSVLGGIALTTLCLALSEFSGIQRAAAQKGQP